jgi:serine/threonine protein kinase
VTDCLKVQQFIFPNPFMEVRLMVPTPASFTSPSPYLTAARKEKWRCADGMKINRLVGADGSDCMITSTQARGHYGKFRYGLDSQRHPCAVKEFRLRACANPTKRTTQPSSLQAIEAEICAIKKFGGPLQLRGALYVKGKVYLLTRLFAGSLLELRNSVNGSPQPFMLRYLLQHIAARLSEEHACGWLHGDVKPDNILFRADGMLCLCDFGMSREARFSATTQDMALRGTYGFMAPEYLDSGQSNCAYDIFALGMVLADFVAPQLRPRATSQAELRNLSLALQQWRSYAIQAEPRQLRGHRFGQASFRWEKVHRDWDAYFTAFYRVDPQLCSYVVLNLLHPQPQARPSAAMLQKVGCSLLAQQPGGVSAMQQVCSAAAQGTGTRQHLLQRLDLFRRSTLLHGGEDGGTQGGV